jgi:hypothetical protein
MTTNITRFTMDVGEVLLGRDPAAAAAARHRAAHTWAAIVGFAAGAALGAALFMAAGPPSVALPTGLALLALASVHRRPRRQAEHPEHLRPASVCSCTGVCLLIVNRAVMPPRPTLTLPAPTISSSTVSGSPGQPGMKRTGIERVMVYFSGWERQGPGHDHGLMT